MILPLSDLLNIPLSRLSLVVDNAKSPVHAVSMQKNMKLERKPAKRSISWDGANSRNRWSSMPVSAQEQQRSTEETRTRRRAPPRRSSSMDVPAVACSVKETKSAGPMRKPMRRTSPPNLIRKHAEVAPNFSISKQEECGTERLSTTSKQRDAQSVSQRSPEKLSPFKNIGSCNHPLRIPRRHQSPKISVRKNVQESQDSSPASVRERRLSELSTAELLSQALDEFGQGIDVQ